MSNIESKPINTAGLNIIRQDYQESDGNNYATGVFSRFDNRMNNPKELTLDGVLNETILFS